MTKAGERLGLEDMNGEIRAGKFNPENKIYINYDQQFCVFLNNGSHKRILWQKSYFKEKCKLIGIDDLTKREKQNLFKILLEL